MYEPIDSESAAALVQRVLAHRQAPVAATAALLELFPRVCLRPGYVLDYVQPVSADGVRLPDRPFARTAAADELILLDDDEPTRQDLVDQLYRYLGHEASGEGLFEYALFVLELWTPRTSGHDADWFESTPIVDAATFETCLQTAAKVADLQRPTQFAPLAQVDEAGRGRVRFLVHTPIGRARIYYLECRVHGDGFLEQETGDLVADLGAGLMF